MSAISMLGWHYDLTKGNSEVFVSDMASYVVKCICIDTFPNFPNVLAISLKYAHHKIEYSNKCTVYFGVPDIKC